MVIVLMGVSGAGKTTVGRLLAATLGWPFYDADDFHSPANVALMRSGTPLTDADRAPWLATLRELIAGCLRDGASAVLAASALKASYRDAMTPEGAGPDAVRFVYLEGDQALLRQRLAARAGHFMPVSLLASQFAALQEPRDAVTVDVAADPATIVERIRAALRV